MLTFFFTGVSKRCGIMNELRGKLRILCGKLRWKLRGDNCPLGWLTQRPLLKMRGQPVRWLALGMTASWRHQGEARRIESEISIHLSFLFHSLL